MTSRPPGSDLTLDAALALVAARFGCVAGEERVPVAEADGRILARAIMSATDLPAFDNAAVDGFALRAAEALAPLPVALRLAAGDPPAALPPGAAARILTGAPLPEGADALVMQEEAALDAEGRLRLAEAPRLGAHIRRRGEDVAAGATLVPAGRRLGPAALALLGAAGPATVWARRPLAVALASTGDELSRAVATPGPDRIGDANRPMLAALLARLGCRVSDLGILPDRAEAVATALAAASGAHDLVVTSGGISGGEEDHVAAAVSAAGRIVVRGVALKPGRPVAVGTIGRAAFVGLPGNPAAAFVTFLAVARPLVARLAGETWRPPQPLPVPSGFALASRAGRREYVRATLGADRNGRLAALRARRDATAPLSALAEAEGFVVLPEETESVRPGDLVSFVPLAAFL